MFPGKIECKSCGYLGIAEIYGRPDTLVDGAFRNLGHNPYTGDLRFQCPSCHTELIISPMEALDRNITTVMGFPDPHVSSMDDISQGLNRIGMAVWGFIILMAVNILIVIAKMR